MEDYQKLLSWILKITVCTLALVIISVVIILLQALFVDQVDNKDIFSIIGPAFNTIVGAFVGLLGGLSLNKQGMAISQKQENKDKEDMLM